MSLPASPAPHTPKGTPMQNTASCPTWCPGHPTSHPTGDGLCSKRVAGDFGEVVFTYSPDDGPLVGAWNLSEEMTPAAAEKLALVLLATLARGAR